MIGTVLSIGKKNVKVKFKAQHFLIEHIKYIPFDKIAEENEKICIVWEKWKGKNGRGGYRLEKIAYKEQLIIAKEYPYQKLIWEDSCNIILK